MAPEMLIARHHAPTLMGLKCSSLSCLGRNAFSSPWLLESLAGRGLGFRFFTNAGGCRLLFSYRAEQLEKALSGKRAAECLSSLGYPEGLEERLDHLASRLKEESFPHEIGFFLGYPEEDVIAFQENGGQGFAHSGMWKMYHNVEEGKALCERWRACTQCLLEALRGGQSLLDLLA